MAARRVLYALMMLAAPWSVPVRGADPVPPTHADVPYGAHERQRVDVYLASSDGPTPVVLFIHGGGWMGGDKSRVFQSLDMPRLLDAGISIVSVNYRLIPMAQDAGVQPPVKWPLEDAARALQFTRSQAGAWKLDTQRIAASGGSAGACSSLWLALHDDMARPDSPDPVARESTRLIAAAVNGAQTSLDPHPLREWMPNMTYGGHAFGFRAEGRSRVEEFQKFFEARDSVLPFLREYSPIEHASADDPPLYLAYSQDTPAVKGQEQKDPTHSASLGLMLIERLAPLGVETILDYPAAPDDRYAKLPTSSSTRCSGPSPAEHRAVV